MIWHTGGDTWLIDGETDPHVLRGIGSEDLFGHSFGVYPDMSQWTGGAARRRPESGLRRGGRLSLFRRGQRPVQLLPGDAVRNASQRYGKRPVFLQEAGDANSSSRDTGNVDPLRPFDCQTFDDFNRAEFPETPPGQWPPAWQWGGRTLTPVKTKPELTWIDFTRWFRRDATGNVGTQPAAVAAYAETVIAAPSDSGCCYASALMIG